MAGSHLVRLYWIALAVMSIAFLAHIYSLGLGPWGPEDGLRTIDFATVWGAANRVLSGEAQLVYDLALHEAHYSELIGQPPADGLAFGYPPHALALIAPLALVPFWMAYLALVGASYALWVLVLRSITRDTPMALAMGLAMGGATQSILLGQNGFLTASLAVGGLTLIPSRPKLAGVLFGLLTIKPHLGVAIAVFLVVTRQWRATASAVLTMLALVLLSVILFGPGIWSDFLTASSDLAGLVASKNDNLIATMMQSPLAIAAGFMPFGSAIAVHIASAACAIILLVWIILKSTDHPTRAAAVIATTLLVTPYSFLYDSTMLTGAAALLLVRYRRRLEVAIIGAAMVLPGIWFFTLQPFVPLTALLLLLICLLRVTRKRQELSSASGTQAST